MKIDVWYRATWYIDARRYTNSNYSIVVKRISDIVTSHDELAGLISYEVIKYPGYKQSQFVPDCWILTELSSLEQEML